MLRVEVEPRHVSVERVQVSHPLGHVNRELQRTVRIYDEATAVQPILLVKYLIRLGETLYGSLVVKLLCTAIYLNHSQLLIKGFKSIAN